MEQNQEIQEKANKVMGRLREFERETWLVLDWDRRIGFGKGFATADKYEYGKMRLYDLTKDKAEIAGSEDGFKLSGLIQTKAIPNLIRKGILDENVEIGTEQMGLLLPDFVCGYVHAPQYYYGMEGIYFRGYEGYCHQLEFQPADDDLPRDRFFYRLTKIAGTGKELMDFLRQNNQTDKKAYNDLRDNYPWVFGQDYIYLNELVLSSCAAGPGNDSYAAMVKTVCQTRG